MNLSITSTLHIRTQPYSRIQLPQPCHYQRCNKLITEYPFVTKRTATHYSKIHSYHIKCAYILSLLTDEHMQLIKSELAKPRGMQRILNRNGKPL